MKILVLSALSLASVSYAFGHCGSCGTGQPDKADHAHDAAGKHAAKLACGDGCCDLVATYEGVSTALASDDLPKARTAAEKLACWADCEGKAEFGAAIAKVAKADSLDGARTAFKAVSAAAIPLVEGAGELYIMTCPMAGADWIQTTKQVANPYYGSSMLRCGTIKKTVAAKL